MELSAILEIISNIMLVVGLIFMGFGVLGLFRFKNFFLRSMATAKVDTVGSLTILFALVIRSGVSWFSAKLILLAVLIVVLGPLCHHMVARSAYLSGYKTSGEIEGDKAMEEEETS